MNHTKRRIFYAALALALFAAEVCIALFAHDNFVRPYLGDVLAVALIHCALRVLWPVTPRLLPLYVFLFACFVEATQAAHLADLLHVRPHVLRVLMGESFSWGDILCYAAGCAAAAVPECINYARNHRKG